MAGSISAATVGTIVAATAAAGSLGYGIYAGQQQQGIQKQQLAAQNTVQQQAEANSLSTQRQAAVAQNAANRQVPDVARILGRAAMMGNAGLSSTMLTGAGGVSGGTPLGKNTLLGS